MQESKSNDNEAGYSRWVGIGIEFGGVVAVFSLIGFWLDKKLDSSPWFLLAGFFIGFIGMFYTIWKQTRSMRK